MTHAPRLWLPVVLIVLGSLVIQTSITATAGRTQGKADIISAKGRGTFRSPDGKYVAELNHGEGDALYLSVFRAGDPSRKPLISESDVPGIIWDPAKPHRLIYFESAIYGEGKIAEWTGGKQKVLWRRNVYFERIRWNLRKHRLQFATMDADGVGWPKKVNRSIPLY